MESRWPYLLGGVNDKFFVDSEEIGGVEALLLILALAHVLHAARNDLSHVLYKELLCCNCFLGKKAPRMHTAFPKFELLCTRLQPCIHNYMT